MMNELLIFFCIGETPEMEVEHKMSKETVQKLNEIFRGQKQDKEAENE